VSRNIVNSSVGANHMIKNIISKLTKPKGLCVCEMGKYWVDVSSAPVFSDYGCHKQSVNGGYKYKHKYSFQRFTQNWLGVWGAKSEWWLSDSNEAVTPA